MENKSPMTTFFEVIKRITSGTLSVFILLVGLMAVVASAAIEWTVLQEFLTIPVADLNDKACALLTVVVLEGAKFALYFYCAGLNRKDLDASEIDVDATKGFLTAIRGALVVFSAFCSLVFFTNVFYVNNSDALQSAIDAETLRIEAAYAEGLEQLESDREAYLSTLEAESGYSVYEEAIIELNTQLSEIETRISNINVDNNGNPLSMDKALEILNAQKADVQAKIDAAQVELDNIDHSAIEEAVNELYGPEGSETLKLEAEYGPDGTARTALTNPTPEMLSEGDNEYIKTFLSAFWQTLFGKMYGRGTYLLVCAFIGLLISIALECIIAFTQRIMVMNSETVVKIMGGFNPIDQSAKVFADNVISMITSALICMAAFLIFNIVTNLSITRLILTITGVTYFVVIFLQRKQVLEKSTLQSLVPKRIL